MDPKEIPHVDPGKLPKTTHSCVLCKSRSRANIEERYAKGWRLVDIAKTYSVKFLELKEHFKETGLEKKYSKQRKISIEKFCDEVIRASYPLLEGKSATKGLYVRDAIDAAKVKMKVKDEKKIEDLWQSVEEAAKETPTEGKKKQTEKIIHRLQGVITPDKEIEQL